jgi:hypothetical protein
VIRVRVGEEQVELALAQLVGDRRSLALELVAQLLISAGKAVELDEVARAILELLPRARELTMLGGFARLLPRSPRVVPRARLGELLV